MRISENSIHALQKIITGDSRDGGGKPVAPYQGGPRLVAFFNDLGFDDEYPSGGGFPARWEFCEERLQHLNDSPGIAKAIDSAVNQARFLDTEFSAESAVEYLNAHLALDGIKIRRSEQGFRVSRVAAAGKDHLYSLLVTSKEGAWNAHAYVYDRSRVFEYTDAGLSQDLGKLDAASIERLLTLPCVFAYEAYHTEPARIGSIKSIRERNGDVRIEFSMESEFAPISKEELERLAWDLDIGNYEMDRTHWAIKEVDLLQVLASEGLVPPESTSSADIAEQPNRDDRSTLVVSPTVFRPPSATPEEGLVSVMMPFNPSFSPTYDAIAEACADASMRCERVDGLWEESDVIQDIFNLIFRSQIVVVDFSERNPNVMYETGIAHTLGRPVVPLSRSIDHVPFDLRHHRVLEYLPNKQGLGEMREALAKRLSTIARKTS